MRKYQLSSHALQTPPLGHGTIIPNLQKSMRRLELSRLKDLECTGEPWEWSYLLGEHDFRERLAYSSHLRSIRGHFDCSRESERSRSICRTFWIQFGIRSGMKLGIWLRRGEKLDSYWSLKVMALKVTLRSITAIPQGNLQNSTFLELNISIKFATANIDHIREVRWKITIRRVLIISENLYQTGCVWIMRNSIRI